MKNCKNCKKPIEIDDYFKEAFHTDGRGELAIFCKGTQILAKG